MQITAHFEPFGAAYSSRTAAAQVSLEPVGRVRAVRMVHEAGTVVKTTVVDGEVRGAPSAGLRRCGVR
jgi:hypothetical protein